MSTYRMPAALPVPVVQELGADTTLPGLRGLKDLADCRPVIVIDSREQAPLRFEPAQGLCWNALQWRLLDCRTEARFAVERKSVDDMANCCLG